MKNRKMECNELRSFSVDFASEFLKVTHPHQQILEILVWVSFAKANSAKFAFFSQKCPLLQSVKFYPLNTIFFPLLHDINEL